ncbi:type IV secretory system conjugative DNA transfer family protein [Acidithrix ferrooxidans]|uniref:AAA-like domain protein n=1 Tax=Acidithrix ferrooxidans TaxID=1280514 RepID=A0A0D8HJR0_9ACTN|nr:type IV secretory system conjugative DNA transfer family protein [Acidithrix ferrooxidans]KJF18185.1 AAA-like domain protein [Acidithrix ferrooxidans]
MNVSSKTRCWYEISWPRPFDPESAIELLSRLSADRSLGTMIWETWGQDGAIRNLVGIDPGREAILRRVVTTTVDGAQVIEKGGRIPITQAITLRFTKAHLAIDTERITATVRAVLAGLAAPRGEHEDVVLQVLLGPRTSPSMLPAKLSDAEATWLDLIRGSINPASAEQRKSLKTRASHHGFQAAIRIGAKAERKDRARSLIAGVIAGTKVAESAGVRIRTIRESPQAIMLGRQPWRWPLRMSVLELAGVMGWPLGEGPLPGVAPEHPKQLAAPSWLKNSERAFAVSTVTGTQLRLGVSSSDSLQHTVLLGPTGSGKSTTMLNLICADINAGRGVLVIDPKFDLTNEVLGRIPDSRKQDVVVIDPANDAPVGLNPLGGARRNPELVADSILAVFKSLFADSWGPRTQDILTSALITLARQPTASLVWLPALLTDPSFRHRLTRHITDEIGLGSFWSAYDAMSPQLQAQVIAPVMNKLRQFLLRPALRAILSQTEPRFSMEDLFTKRRIVLVSLNKGLIGAESARLLGSLVVSQLWPLTLARAALPPERRHVTNVYIDEVQDYLALPTDLADALSQARSLGVGLTIAHQYRSQLPPSLRAGIDSNARTKIVFGLDASDAAEMTKMAPNLEAEDFMLLPRFSVYTQLMVNGNASGWISGRTLPAPKLISDPVALRQTSAINYGRSKDEVEADILSTIGSARKQDHSGASDQIGRRPRRTS